MKHITVLLLSLAIAIPACLAASGPSVGTASAAGDLDFSRPQPALRISKSTPEHTQISLSSPQILQMDSLVDFRSYRLYALDGEPFEWIDGHPAIPQVTRLYRIPNTGSVELAVNYSGFEVEDGVDVLPVQVEINRFPGSLFKAPAVYSADEWYPPLPVVMSSPMIYRDFRVVQITLYPIQVNPRLRQVRVYHDLTAEIIANDTPGENELINPRRPSGAFAALYRAHIANLDERSLDDMTISPGGYLILCRNSAIPLQWADTLATWKRRMGYTVAIESRASWTSTSMRDAIISAYNNSNPPLEFVCIMGDPVGSFSMPTGTTGSNGNYDHYFASLTADDIEDIGVGRLPASYAQDFSTILTKILAYERTPYMLDPDWFGRAFLYAGVTSSFTSNLITMRWAKQQFINRTGIQTVNVASHDGNVNTTSINTRLNEGVAFFLWRGTVVGEMSTGCANGTNNGSKLPVVLTITCGTGDFDNSTCVSESWILAGSSTALKGGVCGIGTATYGTHVHYNNTIAGGLVYNICNLGIEHAGIALAGAKAQLYAAFPSTSDQANAFTRWTNLMGDPGLSMWTRQPIVMNVTYPGTINVGTRRIRPQVIDAATSTPIKDARVVIWKGTECFAMAISDEFGFADVPITVLSPGTMTLTATKRNHKPFLADINCVAVARMVAYSSYSIDDDNANGTSGNANGVINPNEIIDLPIYLRNFGLSLTATAISATLTSNHSGISIVNGTQNYPDIAAQDSALSASPFRISIAPTVRHGTNTVLTLAVATGSELTYSSIPITVKAGAPIFETCQVIGGNGNQILEPGENAGLRLTVRNVGNLTMDAVTGQLVSNSQYVTVLSGLSSYGAIPVGGTANNAGQEFQVRANVHTYPGHPAAMLAVFTTTSGYCDTVRFTLTIGTRAVTDPTGPDAYGYYAYENTDVSYELSRPYNYFNINTGLGTNLNINDPGEQQPSNPIFSVVRTLPFTFRFYGQDYSQITICSNGWAAFGDQHELDMFRNYPIPGQQAPDALIAPFWDDLKTDQSGLGIWDYAAADSHWYVIQWRARGAVNSNLQDFEVILLDPAYYPTRDGNGKIVVQYSSVAEMTGDYNDIKYSTIGIQAPSGLVGLQYRFNNTAASGAGSLSPGRSIVFTTECYAAFGDIAGFVTDAETSLPMSGVVVSVDGTSEHDTTDAAGFYFLNDVLAGTYSIRASYPGFNDGVVDNVVVEIDSTDSVHFNMLHPEIALSVDHVHITLPNDPIITYFNLTNDGNGPLNYSIKIQYNASGSLDDYWDHLTGIDVTGLTGDLMIQGCEFIGDHWYVSGGNFGGHRQLYKFDLNGMYVGSIQQPSDVDFGWFDMAYDGNYLYGSNSSQIVGIDLNGTVQTCIPSPLNPTRALAYDAETDHFWVADYTSEVFEISRDSTIVRHFSPPAQIYGLAWNPQDADGYRLYAFCRDSANAHARVYRIHPSSGESQFLVQLDRQLNDQSGGCTITSGWNSTLLVFGGILQNPAGDRLGIWELDFNTSWISITPMFGSVPAGTVRQMEIMFNPNGLRDATYRVNMFITNNTVTPEIRLPVALTVSLDAENSQVIPFEYRLDQNFPNPFNGRTTFRYELKQDGLTTLRLYNLLGQEVATVVNGLQTTGTHTISFDMRDLPSGVYIYRLSSGSFSESRKMMLIR